MRRTWSDVLLSVWGVLVFAFLFLPIAVIIVYSFNEGRLLVSFTEFGFTPFRAIVEKPVIRSAVIVSIQTGAIAAVLSTVLGTLAGVAMARRPGPGSRGSSGCCCSCP